MRWGSVYNSACTIVLATFLSFSLLIVLWIIFTDLFNHDRRQDRERE